MVSQMASFLVFIKGCDGTVTWPEIYENLHKEYETLKRKQEEYEAPLSALPKGYLSQKTINGRCYWYLQRREGTRVVSQYVRRCDLSGLQQQLKQRQQIEAAVREVKVAQKRLKRAIGDGLRTGRN